MIQNIKTQLPRFVNIKEVKAVAAETVWKLIFEFTFETLLFELKLARPALALLSALLLTRRAFVFSKPTHESIPVKSAAT